eukprot:gnl/TRDRNA2_/TRDRNA2_199472_c0_seq1.p1 gnl/TRDRNA2_/TRDRNA2_199472_c0~~gnl/TRDRNA2_/TRDRNA2_199472_c0_seq1.p1  ORF type:complete len:231 (-),score=40.18 gnl/TRDRNA2_/TRDRNA2_199472_c0_seq1:85-777(-)
MVVPGFDREIQGPLPPEMLQEISQRLRYIRIVILGLWICAIGRWIEGNPLGAINDLFASAFGACLLRDDVLPIFGLSQDQVPTCPTCENGIGGLSCLSPFVVLSGLNALFDTLTLLAVCMPCFKSLLEAQTSICGGCFYTFGAAVLQASGSLLAWQIYKTLVAVGAYGEVEAMQSAVAVATPPTLSPESRSPVESPSARSPSHVGAVGQPQPPVPFMPFTGQAHVLQPNR